ncbi:lanthionine synthetase [Longispora fulva]|uniref:Type 2 lantibiotic biosynthesis protein LanM n=1 Tax=Longispora fulva TaxID=619741 RepID=A0A8J7GR96_9ACTN|nr:type 2 lanthipeptide synthetase LanM family protein [Longispora fulva]MBG6137309.1 type 2 lantibiotic biosynthesis protein LanM [Longispora fulva]GIG61336.1 lanthionine synthetase [Longispora fulva]
MTPDWWARGLTLAERLDLPDAPGVAGPDRRRFDLWLRDHPTAGEFAARLSALGLDQDGLAALLDEDPVRLAGRSERPQWAALVEEILAGVPDSPLLPAAGTAAEEDQELTWAEGFGAVVAPFTRWASARVAADPALLAAFEVRLGRTLIKLAARCLVLELNVARVSGRLTADTPARRFAEFIRIAAGREGLATLLAEYPVLARLLVRVAGNAADAYTEILRRWAGDRERIVAELLAGVDPGALVAVEVSAGDGHEGGRSVAILRCESGARVVYKPRPMAVHRHFTEVVHWLNALLPEPGLRPVAAVEGRGYGWSEFVPAEPCAAPDDLDLFYRRQGVLLALLYALDGTDIHYENLIAHGAHPVLIDVETLFHPVLKQDSDSDHDPAAQALYSSVHRVALLPRIYVTDAGVLDISGLGGDRGAVSPFDSVDWDAAGTDEMRLTRRPRVFRGSHNRPTLHGLDAVPEEFTGALLAGFRAGYDTIVAHREDLLARNGLLRRFAGAEVRVLARTTRWYVRILDESTHPDVMRDALDRDRLFDQLWLTGSPDAVRRALLPHETADLWAGDVPLFSARPAATELWHGPGRPVACLPETSLDRVIRKLRSLDRMDRYDQEWIIEAAMLTRGARPEHFVGPATLDQAPSATPDPDRLLAAARRVADQLVGTAYQGDGRTNWLGLEPLDGLHWEIQPLGAGLASGYCGPALFLAELATLTHTERYAELARQAVRPLPAILGALAEHPRHAALIGPGGFAGFGGMAYALSRLATLLDDPELLGWAEQAVHLTASAVTDGIDPGVYTGVAGGLAAMVAVHRITGFDAAWKTAGACADWLLARRARAGVGFAAGFPGGGGFADGSTGIGWALIRYAAAGGGVGYEEAGLAALRAGVATDPDPGGPSHCHGLTGAGIAAAEALGSVEDPTLRALVRRAVAAVADYGPLPNHSLCHGELGVLELLTAAADLGHPWASALRVRRAGALLASLDRSGPRCGTPEGIATPGLLAGLAGIGHGVLRLGFADKVPSASLLRSR